MNLNAEYFVGADNGTTWVAVPMDTKGENGLVVKRLRITDAITVSNRYFKTSKIKLHVNRGRVYSDGNLYIEEMTGAYPDGKDYVNVYAVSKFK